jgi:hypothetical protein
MQPAIPQSVTAFFGPQVPVEQVSHSPVQTVPQQMPAAQIALVHSLFVLQPPPFAFFATQAPARQ